MAFGTIEAYICKRQRHATQANEPKLTNIHRAFSVTSEVGIVHYKNYIQYCRVRLGWGLMILIHNNGVFYLTDASPALLIMTLSRV